jgi:hypothetical protein
MAKAGSLCIARPHPLADSKSIETVEAETRDAGSARPKGGGASGAEQSRPWASSLSNCSGEPSFEHSNGITVYSTWSPFGYWYRKPSPPKTATIRSGLTSRPVSSWTSVNDGLCWIFARVRSLRPAGAKSRRAFSQKRTPSAFIADNGRDAQD